MTRYVSSFFDGSNIPVLQVTDLDKNWKPDGTKGECGKRSVLEEEISAFLAGGVATELGAFPYMAILGYDTFVNKKNETKKNYNCGGSLINRWYVLTAAHCMFDLLANSTNHPT